MRSIRQVVAIAWLAGTGLTRALSAQTLQPGFVDPGPVISVEIAAALMYQIKSLAVAATWTLAEQYSREHPEAFDKALRLANDHPKAFEAAVKATPIQHDAVAASLAIIASDEVNLAKALAGLASDSASLANAAEAARKLAAGYDRFAVARGEKTFVSVFADGNIRGVATGSADNSLAGTGVLGVRIQKPRSIWTAAVNVASTIDTVTEQFGELILLPGTGSDLLSGVVDAQFRYTEDWGLHVYLSGSKSLWEVDPATHATSTIAVLGIGATGVRDIYQKTFGANRVGLSLEGGLSLRRIAGDIGTEDAIRTTILGTGKKTFVGIEAGARVTFNSVTAALQFYGFPASSENRVRGLTGGQFAAGFSVQASIFQADD